MAEEEIRNLRSKHIALEVEKRNLQELLLKTSCGNEERDNKFFLVSQESSSLSNNLKAKEKELNDLISRFRKCVAAVGSQQEILSHQNATLRNAEIENEDLKQKVEEYNQKNYASKKVKQNGSFEVARLKSDLELEKTYNRRLKTFLERAKINLASSESECANLLKKNTILTEENRKLEKEVSKLKKCLLKHQMIEEKCFLNKTSFDQKLKKIESDNSNFKQSLFVANQRIEHLKIIEFECKASLQKRISLDLYDDESEC